MTRQEKIQFIKQHFPEYHTVNAYMNLRFINQVKDAFKALYSNPTETAVANLIMEAQGKRMRLGTRVESRNKKLTAS